MTTTETAIVQTDLDRLAERVEKTATLVQQLREDRARFEHEKSELAQRVLELETRLQGQDVPALMQEIAELKREQRDWHTERRDVAGRIESLLKKLERLEG